MYRRPTEPGRRRSLGLHALLLAATALLAAGCGEEATGPPPPPPTYDFPIEVAATTRDGEPLPKAPVTLDGKVVGYTDKEGRFTGTVHDREGASIRLGLEPLDGFRFVDEASVTEPLRVTRVGDQATPVPIGLQAKAQSLKNEYMVWVRARCGDGLEPEDCSGLPVLLDGLPVGTTDFQGYTHFTFAAVPDEEVELVIETPAYDKGAEESVLFEPRSPRYAVTLDLDPQIYVVDELFEDPVAAKKIEPKPRPKSRRRAPAKRRNKPRKKPEGKGGGDDGIIDLW